MSRQGGPAPSPPPENEALTRVTLLSCQESLRTAIRLLSLHDPHRPGVPTLDAGASSGDDSREPGTNATMVRDFEAAGQAYDDLITNITHDVKTSLTVIRGHAQMMARAIRRGDAIDHDALLATLRVIDASALRISGELDGRLGDDGRDPG